jgi:hypothetical protein
MNMKKAALSLLFSLFIFGYATLTVKSAFACFDLSSIPEATINEGDVYHATGSFYDPHGLSWTGTVNYGDGSDAQTLNLSNSSFTLDHIYPNSGIYTVTVTVETTSFAQSYSGTPMCEVVIIGGGSNSNTGGNNQPSNQETVSAIVTVQRQLKSLSPVNVWIGLKNSDDVGTRFDLKAEILKDGLVVAAGELNSFSGGSSGFNNAHLAAIPLNLIAPINFPVGSFLSLRLSVRNTCTGPSHNSGVARLWYNDSMASSQFGLTIGNIMNNYFLGDGYALITSVGLGPKKTIDVQSGAKCSAFKPFGTWTTIL